MARTTPAAVKNILMRDYDTLNEPIISGFIDTASLLVTRVKRCADHKGVDISLNELEMIERWLAAHCYAMSDQPYSSRANSGLSGQVSGAFQGKTGMYLEATKYGQMAISLDPSGCLTAIGNRRIGRVAWLGKPPSDQICYEDRN